MKLRWPKFLTVKRTILFALLIAIIIFVLVYLLGGYKAAKPTDDRMPFSTEGFIDIEEYIEDEIDENNKIFASALSKLTVDNYKTQVTEVEKLCKTVAYYSAFSDKLEELKQADPANADKYENNVKTETLITDVENAKQTMNEFRFADGKGLEKLDANGNGYRLYLNYFTTQFKIVRVENNVEVNEWYSNPQNTLHTQNVGSTLTNQKSPLILYYYTPNGATLPYNAFEYSINDNQGDEQTPAYVDQTFSYRFDHENGTLQVYYTFEQKGDKYSDYPKYISNERYQELIKRNQENLAAFRAEVSKYTEKQAQDYFNAHYSVKYIRNFFATISQKDYPGRTAYIGPEAFKFMKGYDVTKEESAELVNLSNLPELFKDLSLNDKRRLCLYMWRLEFEFIQNGNHEFAKAKLARPDSVYFADIYNFIDKENEKETSFGIDHYVYDGTYNEEGISSRIRQLLKQTLIKKLFYTEEDLAADQQRFSVEVVDDRPSFKACVQYTLTEDGFSATIINNSLKEAIDPKSNKVKYPIYKIEILPYFSAISDDYAEIKAVNENGMPTRYETNIIKLQETNGYIVIPDGSGGLVNFNNGKLSYSKRVYTTDLAFVEQVKQTHAEEVLLPMYALSYDGISFGADAMGNLTASSIIARATKGAPQMVLNAAVSSASDSYNKAFFAATYRESQEVTIGTGYYATPVTSVTQANVLTDFTVEYSLINEGGLTYSDIAKRYQEMLIGDILDNNTKDETNETVVNAEYLGLYDYTTNFLGIVYDGHDTLTTYGQAVEITKQLKDWGANKINVQYLGWQKSGLVNETFGDMKFTKKLGSKDELQAMLDYFKQNDVTLYPNVSFYEVNKFDESFGKIRYASRDISSEFTEKYPYDLASGIFDKTQRAIYTISPKFYYAFVEDLVENFNKNNPTLGSMAFEKLGSKIVGDYEKRQEFFRQDSVIAQIGVFNELEANNIKNITLTAPYEYAVKYADNIVELPYSSTLLDIFDYSIPFYQLVFSGFRDYSGLIVNANDEKGLNNHVMKILETGSNIDFTFSYDSSDELIQTDYNYYYYTQYSDWEREVRSLLTVMDSLELHKYYLASHEIVNGNTSVFKVTYKVKDSCKALVTDDEFSVYLNYSDMEIDLANTNLTIIDVENAEYKPFINKTTSGKINPWSCATDKEVA